MSHATFNDPAERALNPKSGEYRDGSDVMGSGTGADYRAFNLPHRLYMNWLPESDMHQLYDDDLAAKCGNGKEVTAHLHTYLEQAGPANSKKGLVIKDCQDGRDWFISTNYPANPGKVLLHRCHATRTPDSCSVTDLFESATPPDGSDPSVTHIQFAASEAHRFAIKIGVPDAATGVVPVTVSNCTCTSTTATTTTSTTTTTTLLDTGLNASWVAGSCTRGDWGAPVVSMYGHAVEALHNCTEEGAEHVATEAECEKACYLLGATAKQYRRVTSLDGPGCSLMTTHYVGNCRWNANPDAIRTKNAYSRSICKNRAGRGGSRHHPDAGISATACEAWCADGAANPGVRGCEFIYDGPAAPGNGCYTVHDPRVRAGGGRVGNTIAGSTNNRFCWVIKGDTTIRGKCRGRGATGPCGP